MKIWLDDERDPRDPFVQEEFLAEPGMMWVKSSGSAINLLKSGNVNYISLDHDLGPGAGSGYDVARWIEEQAYYGRIPRLAWNVHSQNAVGAKNITRAMLKAEEYWRRRETKS